MSAAPRPVLRPYGLVLLPFLGLSFGLHAATGIALAWKDLTRGATSSYDITPFGTPPPSSGAPAEPVDTIKPDRMRRFRLSYFPSAVIPWDWPAPEVVPEPTPEPEPPPVVVAVVKPPTPPTPAPTPTPVPTEGLPTGTYETGVDTGDVAREDGTFLQLPPFTLFTARDQITRTNEEFKAYPNIIVVSDISTETGLEDLFDWMHLFHDVLHNPGVPSPPWVLGVGELMEDPFLLTPELAEGAMVRRMEIMQLFPGALWGDVAIDRDQSFANGLEIESLPAPEVYLCDLEGFVKVRIRGRLKDLSEDQILEVARQIKELWQQDTTEFFMTNYLIKDWQRKLKNDELGDPITPSELLQVIAPPPLPLDPLLNPSEGRAGPVF